MTDLDVRPAEPSTDVPPLNHYVCCKIPAGSENLTTITLCGIETTFGRVAPPPPGFSPDTIAVCQVCADLSRSDYCPLQADRVCLDP